MFMVPVTTAENAAEVGLFGGIRVSGGRMIMNVEQ